MIDVSVSGFRRMLGVMNPAWPTGYITIGNLILKVK